MRKDSSSLLDASAASDIFANCYLTFGLRPLSLAKSCLSAKPGPGF